MTRARYRTKNARMYGLFQTAFYFGYTALGCLALFLGLGTIGYLSASVFVRRLYHNIKLD